MTSERVDITQQFDENKCLDYSKEQIIRFSQILGVEGLEEKSREYICSKLIEAIESQMSPSALVEYRRERANKALRYIESETKTYEVWNEKLSKKDFDIDKLIEEDEKLRDQVYEIISHFICGETFERDFSTEESKKLLSERKLDAKSLGIKDNDYFDPAKRELKDVKLDETKMWAAYFLRFQPDMKKLLTIDEYLKPIVYEMIAKYYSGKMFTIDLSRYKREDITPENIKEKAIITGDSVLLSGYCPIDEPWGDIIFVDTSVPRTITTRIYSFADRHEFTFEHKIDDDFSDLYFDKPVRIFSFGNNIVMYVCQTINDEEESSALLMTANVFEEKVLYTKRITKKLGDRIMFSSIKINKYSRLLGQSNNIAYQIKILHVDDNGIITIDNVREFTSGENYDPSKLGQFLLYSNGKIIEKENYIVKYDEKKGVVATQHEEMKLDIKGNYYDSHFRSFENDMYYYTDKTKLTAYDCEEKKTAFNIDAKTDIKQIGLTKYYLIVVLDNNEIQYYDKNSGNLIRRVKITLKLKPREVQNINERKIEIINGRILYCTINRDEGANIEIFI